METVIGVIILTVIVGAAALYVFKAKKSGRKCIGCPESGRCNGACCCGSEADHTEE